MAERLFVRLAEDREPGPETDAPAGSLRAGHVSTALSPFVTSVLAYREELGDRELLERVVPDGAVRLAFNFASAPSAGGGAGEQVEAIGASSEPALVRLRGTMDGLTVTLRPGTAAALLGVPAVELRGTAVGLDLLWAGEASSWLEELRTRNGPGARLRWLEQALLTRARRYAGDEWRCAARAAQLITSSGGRLSVRATAQTLGISERRLQQLFRQHVGLSPRSYARVARMHALLRVLRTTCAPAWARLADEAGFYDQAHLANEFRALCGLSPSAFLAHVSGSSKTAG